MTRPTIAVLLPCFNEEAAIAQTVASFRAALPGATVYVYDNNSHDRTAEVARAAGAIVRFERVQGKGAVVRRMFADVDADIYVMADGDATYDAASAPALVARLLDEQLDMVVGARVHTADEAYRRGHRFGNALLTGILARLFGRSFSDILSGYRVFSRRFVKSYPALSTGFEIETDISVHALELKMPVAEAETPYFARPEGSASKLNTYGAVPDRAAAAVLRVDRRCTGGGSGGARNSLGADLCAHRAGAAFPHRDRRDRDGDPGRAVLHRRADPRYGGQGSARGAATGLSCAAGARPKAWSRDLRCRIARHGAAGCPSGPVRSHLSGIRSSR